MKTSKVIELLKMLLLTTKKYTQTTFIQQHSTYNLSRLRRQLSSFQDVYRLLSNVVSNDRTKIFYKEY